MFRACTEGIENNQAGSLGKRYAPFTPTAAKSQPMSDHREKCLEAPVTIKFTPTLREQTARAAAHEDMSFGEYVKWCIQQDLDKKDAMRRSLNSIFVDAVE